MRRLFKNPVIFGISAGIAVILFNLAIALLANLIGSVVLLLLIRRHGREPVKII